jgi:hypothetical protein
MLTNYLLTGLKPDALLGMALWPGAAEKNFKMYWAERFLVAVPMELIQLLVPYEDGLEQKVNAQGKNAPPSARTMVKSLRCAYISVPCMPFTLLQFLVAGLQRTGFH